MENLLSMRGVSRRISDDFALQNVDLTVRENEVVGFVGPNGAGKTTIIRVALGLVHLDSGDLNLFEQPFGANADEALQRELRARIGVVMDTCPFPSDHTVRQAAASVSPAYPCWNWKRFEALCDAHGLSLKAKVKSLSRGMGMKLQLICALCHDADLLLLDEATAGLDPIARDGILDELRAFASEPGHGVLLSSHITSDLERIADRVVAIDAGCIAFDLPREEITDVAGIARCTAAQADEVMLCVEGARMQRRDYSVDVLVPDRFAFTEAFPDVACDRASIDEYLHFYLEEADR